MVQPNTIDTHQHPLVPPAVSSTLPWLAGSRAHAHGLRGAFSLRPSASAVTACVKCHRRHQLAAHYSEQPKNVRYKLIVQGADKVGSSNSRLLSTTLLF